MQGYLDSQGAGPFIEAVDRYLALSGKMIRELERRSDAKPATAEQVAADCVAPLAGSRGPRTRWLDTDPVVRRYCVTRGLPVPDDPEEKMALHVLALEEMLAEP